MRNRLLGSLLVFLGGAALASAQAYLPSQPVYYAQMPQAWPGAQPAYPYGYGQPAYPAFRPRPAPAWPVGFQTPQQAMPLPGLAPRPLPQWDPGQGASTGAPTQPAAGPAAPPAGERIGPPTAPPAGEPIGPPAATDPAPGQPMLSPLSPDLPKAFPDELPVPADPPPGAPLVCAETDDVPLVSPHELHPPRHGPRGYRFYGSSDALLWWTKQRSSPVLFATGPLSAPGTNILLGGLGFDDQQRYGGRFTLGTWLTQSQQVGLEIGGLWLTDRRPGLTVGGGSLARPFMDVTTGGESAAVLAAPGTQTGTATVTTLQRLWGAEANARVELLRSCWCHLDFLAGCRYLQLEDQLAILDSTTFAPGLAGIGGASLTSSDRFAARNQFYGGQLGLDTEVHWGRFFVNLWGKLAVGAMHEVVTIDGTTLATSSAGVRSVRTGGLFALPTNIGGYSRNNVDFIPEVGFNVGRQLTPHLRATLGYTFLYIYEVVQAADQIDRGINPTQRPTLAGTLATLTGPARPLFAFNATDFWAQGINIGLEFRY